MFWYTLYIMYMHLKQCRRLFKLLVQREKIREIYLKFTEVIFVFYAQFSLESENKNKKYFFEKNKRI